MDPDVVAGVFKLLIDRADITLEEARNTSQTCTDALAVFDAEGDSLLAHLPLYRFVPKDVSKRKRPCAGGCGKLTTRRFGLHPYAGPICRRCENERPSYHTIDYTAARRRFYLAKDDLEEVPAIMRFKSPVRCRYFRPADLLAVALKRHGGREGLRIRRALGLKRRAAALRGIERRRRRLEDAYETWHAEEYERGALESDDSIGQHRFNNSRSGMSVSESLDLTLTGLL